MPHVEAKVLLSHVGTTTEIIQTAIWLVNSSRAWNQENYHLLLMTVHWNRKYLHFVDRVATFASKTAVVKCKQNEKYAMQIESIC